MVWKGLVRRWDGVHLPSTWTREDRSGKEKTRVNTNQIRLSPGGYIASMVFGLGIVFLCLVLVGQMVLDGLYAPAAAISAVAIFFGLVFLRRTFSAYRWLSIGIALVLIFTIYPIFSTVLISFSNMSGGHLMTRQRAIDRLEEKTFLPEGARVYGWSAYQDEGGDFLLLFQDQEGRIYTGEPGRLVREVDAEEFQTAPEYIEGYRRLLLPEVVPLIERIGSLRFLHEEGEIRVSGLREAAELEPKYEYDADRDLVIDRETGIEYFPREGTFISEAGEELVPGFQINIGLRNYGRFLGNAGYLRPVGRILIWNISFAFFSVIISFGLGLLIALAFDKLPGRNLIRTLLIIPYPIPVLVSMTVWKGLLNESMGLVSNLLRSLFGSSPAFFTDQNWSRVALILINVYLSYPYFFILCSGALRAIPQDLFEAADMDGASGFHKLRFITLPMLLKILWPLLIASFSFNFNNFTLIWGYNAGLPAMADTIVPMGHTDLLISFVYRLGFGTANAANYGFAAAITVLLFFLVAVMVVLQLKSTKALKEADK